MKPFRLISDTPAERSPRYWAGKKANANGENFQKVIKYSLGIHKDIVYAAELPRMGAKRVAGGKLVPCKIPVDFMGSFIGGKALHFDAKNVADDSAFDCKVMVADHQLDHLRRVAQMGGVAGFLVQCGRRQEFLWLPVKHIAGFERIPFDVNGMLACEWISLGEMAKWVRFDLLKEAVKA